MLVIFEGNTIAQRSSYRYTKTRRGSRVTEIACRREDEARADSISMNRCNRRFRDGVEALNNRLHFVLVSNAILTRKAAKLLDIGTGRKCLTFATNNDGANGIIDGQSEKLLVVGVLALRWDRPAEPPRECA